MNEDSIEEQFRANLRQFNSNHGCLCTTSDVQLNLEDNNKMASLKEEAESYEPKKTKNIADLEIVPVELDVFEETGTDNDGKKFTYKYVIWEGQNYRVPNTVLDDLKTMIRENPKTAFIKVIKEGEGLGTRYKVVSKEAPKQTA